MTSAINSTNSLIAGLANVIGTAVNTKQTNRTNYAIAQMTNANNRQLVAMQNEAARKESELAYKRSTAGNQVNLMTSAGMSRAGAINTLNGGGSYTPAPVNTSQDQAPQMQTTDLSGLVNIAQTFAQRAQQKHDEKMQSKQLQEQKRQFNEQLNFEKQKWNDEASIRAENLTALQFQNKINDALANYKDENGNKTNLLVEGAAAERIANIAEQKLNALKYDLINSALELPAPVLKVLINELKGISGSAQSFINDIKSGKKTVNEIQEYTEDYHMPNEISSDGKKFRRVRNEDGSYEWYEVK